MSPFPVALGALAIGLAAASPAATPGLPHMLYSTGAIDQNLLIGDVLVIHNGERRRVGAPPLAWDPALADGARLYANELVRSATLHHSDKKLRPGIGENLWKGTRGYFRPAAMVGAWASERAMFRPATFPDVSTTGNWADVGHYTQMIWPGTQRVGCAIAKAVEADVLVCRYWPSGNVMGKPVP